jgi:type VI secretion system protein ImpC
MDPTPSATTEAIATFAACMRDVFADDKDTLGVLCNLWEETKTAASLIARIDDTIGATLDLVLHHRDFQRLESTWRGLHYLVKQVEPDGCVKVRVVTIRKSELASAVDDRQGPSWLARTCERPFIEPAGEPFSCLVIDAEFDHSPPDVELLLRLAGTAAAAHAPIVAGASPALFQMDTWQELGNPRDLVKIFSTAEYSFWRTLRESDVSRHIALCLPRFLARLPWPQYPPGDCRARREQTAGHHSNFAWSNAAYAVSMMLARAHRRHGWCAWWFEDVADRRANGLNLVWEDDDAGGMVAFGPTEVAVSDRRLQELTKLGLIALAQMKRTDVAAVFSNPTLHRPAESDDPEVDDAKKVEARLAVSLACGRVAQTMQCLARDSAAAGHAFNDTRRILADWLAQRVHDNPELCTALQRANRPFAAAEIGFDETLDDVANVRLRPLLSGGPPAVAFHIAIRLPATSEREPLD